MEGRSQPFVLPGYHFDPVTDQRWNEFLRRHPKASIFHTTAWLRTLQQVYGYRPIVFTSQSPTRRLEDAVAFSLVNRWPSPRRLVSLPFSDHCDPLVSSDDVYRELLAAAEAWAEGERCSYAEIRPLSQAPGLFLPHRSYYFHKIDLSDGTAAVFRRLHVDCVQRKIRRAQRENLVVREGRSEDLLSAFYCLHNQNRIRLGSFPQPVAWFRSLLQEFQESASILLAEFQGTPVAAIMTLEFKDTTVYKYGCSDPRFKEKGGIQQLLWTAIERACSRKHNVLDLGRSDINQEGLVAFKDRWGAEKITIQYYKSIQKASYVPALKSSRSWLLSASKKFLSHMPSRLGPAMGEWIYPYLG